MDEATSFAEVLNFRYAVFIQLSLNAPGLVSRFDKSLKMINSDALFSLLWPFGKKKNVRSMLSIECRQHYNFDTVELWRIYLADLLSS